MIETNKWLIIKKGFDASGQGWSILEEAKWSIEMRKKTQPNGKAMLICKVCQLQNNSIMLVHLIVQRNCEIHFFELHEGTRDYKIVKKGLLLSQMQNYIMKDGETISQLHERFKELFNGLYAIGECVENYNLIRYALISFPKSTFVYSWWMPTKYQRIFLLLNQINSFVYLSYMNRLIQGTRRKVFLWL